MAQNVCFFFGTQAKYDALAEYNEMALYFISDTLRLYKGSQLYATGSVATTLVSGLLSAEDKKKLDELAASGGLDKLVAVDGSISIADGEDGKKNIGVAISTQEGNALQKKDDGLFVAPAQEVEVPEYSIEKQASAEEGYASSYKLKKVVNGETSYVGDTINIAKDMVLQSAVLKKVVEANVPYEGAKIGDPYIEMAFNDTAASHIYVPVKELVDTYIPGDGIKIENNVISVELGSDANGLHVADGKLNLGLATAESAGAMSVEDKKAHDKLVALDIPTTYGKAYEVSHKPVGTLVNYNGKEIRIMCPTNTEWVVQQGGGDPNKYYIGFKAYAPSSDVISFKESLAKTMTDQTMYYFVDNEFAGIDANGRKYSIIWLPAAKLNADSTWTYYGANSTVNKFIGWDYCVEWYNASGVCVASDLIRINLANEDCFNSIEPAYMSNYATKEDVDTAISWETL